MRLLLLAMFHKLCLEVLISQDLKFNGKMNYSNNFLLNLSYRYKSSH